MIKLEIRAFGKLQSFFLAKGWDIPLQKELSAPLTAAALRDYLELPPGDVEVVFVNRQVRPLHTLLKDGDRVAFVPPGIPSIHRFNLGFYGGHEH